MTNPKEHHTPSGVRVPASVRANAYGMGSTTI
jgi:hypothetical protein